MRRTLRNGESKEDRECQASLRSCAQVGKMIKTLWWNLKNQCHLTVSRHICDVIRPSLFVRLVFERVHSLLVIVNTVVKAAFFVVLHPQDPSLQCSPLSHNRNASVNVGRLCTNFPTFINIFSKTTSHTSFVDLIRICSKMSVELNSSGLVVLRIDRFGVEWL